ncbi:MAG: hypothetical protein JXO22_17430 [Phycisphaerae bacterium]|nr:hypothetical protein [Phycisphaerae bacterium]
MFELTDERREELVGRWARKIVDRGIATAAIFLLEAHKPLGGISAQATIAFQPIIGAFATFNVHELAAFMREPDNVERLVLRIEELDRERTAERKAAEKRHREVRRRAKRIRRLRRAKNGR